jgi:hypothetical protein
MYAIKIWFEDGTELTIMEKEEWWKPEGLEFGVWEAPFPNEEGNSTAYGLIENFSQSDDFSQIFATRVPVKVVVAKADNFL